MPDKVTNAIGCGDQRLVKGHKTYIMGIINVTPDSFSDGGEFFDPERAIAQGLRLITEGADILDVGGMSTAPHGRPITIEEELGRVIPVISGLRAHGITAIAVDTMRASVANMALEMGARWINDQSAGLHDQDMVMAMSKAEGVIIMHNGGGSTSGVNAGEAVIYDDVIKTLCEFFRGRIAHLTRHGVDPDTIVIDPGVGFGKGLNDSLTIINHMDRFNDIAPMSLIGLSRKSFIGKITGIDRPKDRDFASLGAHAAAILSGAHIIRTHNVRATVDMASVLDRCLSHERACHEDLH